LNVKAIEFTPTFEQFGSFQLQVNPRELGPKLGESMKLVLAATRTGEWTLNSDGTVTIAGHCLDANEYTLKLKLNDGVAGESLPGNDALVVLDVNITQDLIEEGLARDLVRAVQQARKNAGLHIADHIKLALQTSEKNANVFKTHQSYVEEQVLATGITYGVVAEGWHSEKVTVGESEVTLALVRA
jgi:isoleucyl-tRNA synthetase